LFKCWPCRIPRTATFALFGAMYIGYVHWLGFWTGFPIFLATVLAVDGWDTLHTLQRGTTCRKPPPGEAAYRTAHLWSDHRFAFAAVLVMLVSAGAGVGPVLASVNAGPAPLLVVGAAVALAPLGWFADAYSGHRAHSDRCRWCHPHLRRRG